MPHGVTHEATARTGERSLFTSSRRLIWARSSSADTTPTGPDRSTISCQNLVKREEDELRLRDLAWRAEFVSNPLTNAVQTKCEV